MKFTDNVTGARKAYLVEIFVKLKVSATKLNKNSYLKLLNTCCLFIEISGVSVRRKQSGFSPEGRDVLEEIGLAKESVARYHAETRIHSTCRQKASPARLPHVTRKIGRRLFPTKPHSALAWQQSSREQHQVDPCISDSLSNEGQESTE